MPFRQLAFLTQGQPGWRRAALNLRANTQRANDDILGIGPLGNRGYAPPLDQSVLSLGPMTTGQSFANLGDHRSVLVVPGGDLTAPYTVPYGAETHLPQYGPGAQGSPGGGGTWNNAAQPVPAVARQGQTLPPTSTPTPSSTLDQQTATAAATTNRRTGGMDTDADKTPPSTVLPWFNAGIQGVGVLGNLYLGERALSLGREQFRAQQELANRNYQNQVLAYNQARRDRIDGRGYGTQAARDAAYERERLRR